MSKSILVIDTPENCRECKFSEYQGIVCRAMGLNKAHNNADSKPDWCPLAECGTDLLTREVKGLKYVFDKIKYFEFEESEIRDLEEIDRLKIEVEKYRKAFEDAKKECDCQIAAEYQKKIEDLKHDLKTAGKKIQDLVGENMKLQCERNDYKSKSEFFEIERMRVKQNEISDFLPTEPEPIKVADVLINAEGEYERNPIEKVFCGTDKGTYRIFDISELRQIAEHLLVYCNHNGG